jgi:hypothetical protein
LVPEFRLFRLSHRVQIVCGGSGLASHVDFPSCVSYYRDNPYPVFRRDRRNASSRFGSPGPVAGPAPGGLPAHCPVRVKKSGPLRRAFSFSGACRDRRLYTPYQPENCINTKRCSCR